MTPTADVYLSYSRRDMERVQPWVERLSAGGVNVFEWRDRGAQEMRKCKVVLFVASLQSFASDWVAKELELAFETRKPVIPVFLDDVEVPPSFRIVLANVPQLHAYDLSEALLWQAIVRALASAGVVWNTPGAGTSDPKSAVTAMATQTRGTLAGTMDDDEPDPSRIDPPAGVTAAQLLSRLPGQLGALVARWWTSLRLETGVLICAVLTLVTISGVMLSMMPLYADRGGADYYYFKNQALWFGLGSVAALVLACMDYRGWLRRSWWIYAIACMLLALCFVPGMGVRISGSSRWINLIPYTSTPRIQPSEYAKLALVLVLAAYFRASSDQRRGFLRSILLPLAITAPACLLTLAEMDKGAAAMMFLVALMMCFVGGCRLRHLTGVLLGFLAAGFAFVMYLPNRAARLLGFLKLQSFQEQGDAQQWQAVLAFRAFGGGGTSGLGLGNARQVIPNGESDYILPMIGESLGLAASLTVVLAYAVILWCGWRIARQCEDRRFGRLLAWGLTALITLQAAMNIAVVTAILPAQGTSLPFVSYGGSHMLACLMTVGLLISIHQSGATEAPLEKAGTRRRRRREVKFGDEEAVFQ